MSFISGTPAKIMLSLTAIRFPLQLAAPLIEVLRYHALFGLSKVSRYCPGGSSKGVASLRLFDRIDEIVAPGAGVTARRGKLWRQYWCRTAAAPRVSQPAG